MNDKRFAEVHALVRRIPPGKVATYGWIARWLGWERGARTVGWAMRACPADVPWHRVVNARGGISQGDVEEQRMRLEDEGVTFDRWGRVDLERYGWEGPE
jgi:methylated-DNA-protein-cysteine methyltransferase-like protein